MWAAFENLILNFVAAIEIASTKASNTINDCGNNFKKIEIEFDLFPWSNDDEDEVPEDPVQETFSAIVEKKHKALEGT